MEHLHLIPQRAAACTHLYPGSFASSVLSLFTINNPLAREDPPRSFTRKASPFKQISLIYLTGGPVDKETRPGHPPCLYLLQRCTVSKGSEWIAG